ncbi:MULTISPECIES: family 78 glycoside hydrolase catalytic domain [unclassified Alteromonas]|uniref:family 78 glycoside hydrolase catalytic domain n=1 Tax=unclassified Alteromonas TaxID=2614992 RepID=UPI0005099BDF|nr:MULTISPECIES: family 78 glycoside hydrolase catalytic domain [unclassified Alteromonas]
MRFFLYGLTFVVLMLAGCDVTSQSAIPHAAVSHPTNLSVEGLNEPLNIHAASPSLSWHSNVDEQTHYQIAVASSVSLLQNMAPDLWDSGKVPTSRSLNIMYDGEKLNSRQKVFWRVRVWSTQGVDVSAWSKIASWEMGLTDNADWSAKWIKASQRATAEVTPQVEQWVQYAASAQNKEKKRSDYIVEQLKKQPTAGLYRHEFGIRKKVVSARLHSTAAGYYEMYINGESVDSRIMDPGQTDYEERILYNTDAVESLLKQGNNVISAHLGSGWYNEEIAFSSPTKNLTYGEPKFIAQLEIKFDDGSSQFISTNEKWKYHPSPVLKEGLFSGELHDQRRHVNKWQTASDAVLSSDWQDVEVLSVWPTKNLEPQLIPPVRLKDKLQPVRILSPKPNVWVFDFGQNLTGVPELNIEELNLNPGQGVYLRYAEWIDSEGNISQKSGGAAPKLKQADGYIAAKKNPHLWRPTFTWHGFRYVEITGLDKPPSLESMSAYLVRSDIPVSGQFSSSDELINKVHKMALWGYQSNLISVPFDCPIRERAGWTGDAHAALITGNYNFNMDNFWDKYLGDFRTSPFIAPTVVPGRRAHGGKFDWAVAEVIIAWEHYRHHGDRSLLLKQYESLEEYMTAGIKELDNNMIRSGYGDWCDPVVKLGMSRVGGRCNPQHTSHIITSSALFAHSADLMSKISEALSMDENTKRYGELFERLKEQFHSEMFNDTSGHYGSQTADAMALEFKLVPNELRQSVADKLNDDVVNKWSGHASVGALGQTYLYRALSDHGYVDTAFNIFKAEGYPGYSYLINELHATTLWERKGGFVNKEVLTLDDAPGRSLNHPFHAGYDGWFFEGLGGIRPLSDSVGFQHFMLKPVFPSNLESVDTSYTTGYGEIKSKWQRRDKSVIWNFVVPKNTKATVYLPGDAPKIYKPGNYSLVVK